MKEKVLLNVATPSIQKKLLSLIISQGYDFVEGHGYEDLTFKSHLLKEHILLYIHELDYKRYDEEIEFLRKCSENHYKMFLIIDNYDPAVIDDALSVGVNDMIEMSIDQGVLLKKFRNLVRVDQLAEKETNHLKQDISHQLHNKDIIKNEMARALRGSYELSMILIKYMKHDSDLMAGVMEGLREELRDTDRVLHYDDSHILLVCPFTKKTYIVEVENKVRRIYEEIDSQDHLFTLYGLTYPRDVADDEDILMKLERGINNSLMIGGLRGTLSEIGVEQFEAYKKMLH